MDTPTVGHNPEGTMVWIIFDDVTLMLPTATAEKAMHRLQSVLFDLYITQSGGDPDEPQRF